MLSTSRVWDKWQNKKRRNRYKINRFYASNGHYPGQTTSIYTDCYAWVRLDESKIKISKAWALVLYNGLGAFILQSRIIIPPHRTMGHTKFKTIQHFIALATICENEIAFYLLKHTQGHGFFSFLLNQHKCYLLFYIHNVVVLSLMQTIQTTDDRMYNSLWFPSVWSYFFFTFISNSQCRPKRLVISLLQRECFFDVDCGCII